MLLYIRKDLGNMVTSVVKENSEQNLTDCAP